MSRDGVSEQGMSTRSRADTLQPPRTWTGYRVVSRDGTQTTGYAGKVLFFGKLFPAFSQESAEQEISRMGGHKKYIAEVVRGALYIRDLDGNVWNTLTHQCVIQRGFV